MSETTPVTRRYWIHTLTPLHVGSGRGVGFIDLPVIREVVTRWPFVPGSAVKGVLHDHHLTRRDPMIEQAFGTAGDEYASSGSLVFTDARLICLTVRSYYGTFAWCTSPIAVHRLARDGGFSKELPPLKNESMETMLVPQATSDFRSKLESDGKAYLEDFDFRAAGSDEAGKWAAAIGDEVFSDEASRILFRERFAVVHDDVFTFLCEHATQVDARVRIDPDRRSVAKGALWYEESLPAETILAGLAWCGPVFGKDGRGDTATREKLVQTFCTTSSHLQIGGKATVGRGQVRLSFAR